MHLALYKGNKLSRQVTTTQLWESIRTAGLASADDCRKWARGVTEALGKSVATDPEQLTAALIRFGYLTQYQGNVLLRRLPHPLLLDGIRIEHSLEDKLGPHWYEGRSFPNPSAGKKETEEKPLWVAALSMETMATPQVRDWPPSMTWAEHHAQVVSPHLDRWRTPGATLQHLYAFVEPWASVSLATKLQSGPLPSDLALKMVHHIASALQTLHQAGLVHGQLSLQAILVDSDAMFRLRRDPLFPPRSPYVGKSPSVIDHAHSLLAVAAPELAIPDAIPSARSDLYALGCIWYRCVAERWPVEPAEGASAITWGSLHAKIPIQIPNSLSETASKCMLHLLAKDPAARFPSAEALLLALNSDSSTALSKDTSRAIEKTAATRPIKEPAATYTVAKPPDGETIDKPPAPVEPISVQQVASELRDKKAKVTPREGPRLKGPKPLLAQPVPPAPEPTSVQPVVQSDAPPANSKTEIPTAISQEAPASKPPEPKASPSDPRQETPATRPAVPKAPPAESRQEALGAKPPAPKAPSPPDAKQEAPEIAPPASTVPRSELRLDRSGETPGKPVKKKKRKPNPGQGKQGGSKTKGKTKPKRPLWVMPALVAGSCLALLGLAVFLRGTTPSVVTIENTPNKSSRSNAPIQREERTTEESPKVAADPLAERFDVVADDGKLPWAPPTAGAPYSTDLLPMGIEALVFISSRAWQHQGPAAPLLGWWNSIATEPSDTWWPDLSAPPEAIDQVAIAWYPGTTPSTARFAVRVAFKEPRKISEIINTEDWSSKPLAGSSETARGAMWVRKETSNLGAMLCDDLTTSATANTKHVTFGPTDLLDTILATKETPFVMRRQLETLRQASDATSDLTLLIAPSFLYGDGKEILGSDSPRLLGLLSQMVDDKVQAWMMRVQWDKVWYVEWRTLGNDLQAASRNATAVKTRIDDVANQLEAALVNQPADPYWRAIANRFPQMLRTLTKWMRSGAEEGQVVVNAYLPQEAVSNLLIGSWMAAQRDWSSVVSTSTASKPNAPVKGIEEWLATPMTLRIGQDSLENVLQAVATELKDSSGSQVDPLPMAINGTAFQKDGITRNQQVRNFEFTHTPLREVLTTLARRANPVTTVQSPNEKDQKVVWVVLDDPATPSKKKLEFTTRSWVEANNAALPTEFVIPTN